MAGFNPGLSDSKALLRGWDLQCELTDLSVVDSAQPCVVFMIVMRTTMFLRPFAPVLGVLLALLIVFVYFGLFAPGLKSKSFERVMFPSHLFPCHPVYLPRGSHCHCFLLCLSCGCSLYIKANACICFLPCFHKWRHATQAVPYFAVSRIFLSIKNPHIFFIFTTCAVFYYMIVLEFI